MPHGIFDVVAEHPQEQHVAGQVKHVAVEEHVGEQRRPLGSCRPLTRHHADVRGTSGVPPNNSRGVTAKPATALVAQAADLEQVDEDIDRDQRRRDVLEGDRFSEFSSCSGTNMHAPALALETALTISGSARAPKARRACHDR